MELPIANRLRKKMHMEIAQLQDELSTHNLWEQETIPIVITPRRVRNGVKNFCGSNYLVRRIGRKMFFGFELVKRSGFWVPVSDIEKTIIDFFYYNERIPEEALEEARKRMDRKKMKGYLQKVGGRIASRIERELF